MRPYTANGQVLNQRILDAFQIQIYDPAMTDVIDGQLYDTLEFPEGELPTHIAFFSEPVSPSKSIHLTNLELPRCLPQPQAFAIEKMSVTILEGTRPELDLQIEEAPIELYLGQKLRCRTSMVMMERTAYVEQTIMRQCSHCKRIYVIDTCPSCGSADFRIWFGDQVPAIRTGNRPEYFHKFTFTHVVSRSVHVYVRVHTAGLHGPLRLKLWFTGLHSY